MPSSINTYIGFDFGTKKMGVAKANQITQQASPLDTKDDLSHVENIIKSR